MITMKGFITQPRRSFRLACGAMFVAGMMMGCTSSTTISAGRRAEQPSGFFANLLDQVTERECNVYKFTCPYGFGPAGEPCDCTDPRGVVLSGVTVK